MKQCESGGMPVLGRGEGWKVGGLDGLRRRGSWQLKLGGRREGVPERKSGEGRGSLGGGR